MERTKNQQKDNAFVSFAFFTGLPQGRLFIIFRANNDRFVIAVQTNIPVVEKAHTGYGFLMRDTHVHMQ